jgi:hypothetical protein
MRRAAIPFLLSALMSLTLPTLADAGIWRWIDELSGPGPWNGVQLEARVLCFVPETEEETARWQRTIGGKTPCLFVDESPERRSRVSINFEFGMLWAKDNPIEYGEALDQDQKRVRLFPMQGMLYWEARRGIELGTGGGIFFFSSKHGLFDNFHRIVLEPMRVDVRPFDILIRDQGRRDKLHWKLARTLTFRQSMIFIPKGFDAADFGSQVDPFDSPREVLPSMSMIVDLGAFFSK